MYSYHNRIKQRINNNELLRYEFVDSYNQIKKPCMLLHFDTEPNIRPIREHKIENYFSDFPKIFISKK